MRSLQVGLAGLGYFSARYLPFAVVFAVVALYERRLPRRRDRAKPIGDA